MKLALFALQKVGYGLRRYNLMIHGLKNQMRGFYPRKKSGGQTQRLIQRL
jgi:hypothetical protein